MARSTIALVYAAGFGTRLAPLTDILPKPLLPIGGRPLVAWTLDGLARLGCDRAVLNLHHLGDPIRRAIGSSHRGMPIVYSEEPEILGTLGALAAARKALAGAETVLLVNGDSLCSWPFERLLATHRAGQQVATLLFSARAAPALHGGGVPIDRTRGRVLYFPRATPAPSPGLAAAARRHAPPAVFAGAHAIRPELLELAPLRFADTVLELYAPLLAQGETLAAVTTRRPWWDLGTPRQYLEAALAKSLGSVPGSVIEPGAVVAPGARLERCLILPGARVGAGARLTGVVVGFGAEVPPGARFTDALVAAPGATRPPGGTLREGLLVVPFAAGGHP